MVPILIKPIEPGEAGTQHPEEIHGVMAKVRDEDMPDRVVSFRYGLEVGRAGLHGVHLASAEIAVRGWAGGQPLAVSSIRDLPLTRWENAARAAIHAEWFPPESPSGGKLSWFTKNTDGTLSIDTSLRDAYAERLLSSLYPDVGKSDTPGARRRDESLRKLARAAVEYHAYLGEGRSDPAIEIARGNGVSPATARSWIFRARKAGLLGPSSGTKPGVQAQNLDPLKAEKVFAAAMTDPEIGEITEMMLYQPLPPALAKRKAFELLADSGYRITHDHQGDECAACTLEELISKLPRWDDNSPRSRAVRSLAHAGFQRTHVREGDHCAECAASALYSDAEDPEDDVFQAERMHQAGQFLREAGIEAGSSDLAVYRSYIGRKLGHVRKEDPLEDGS